MYFIFPELQEILILHHLEAATRGVLYKKVFLEIRKIHTKTPVPESLF